MILSDGIEFRHSKFMAVMFDIVVVSPGKYSASSGFMVHYSLLNDTFLCCSFLEANFPIL